jgi:gas vesicle protein
VAKVSREVYESQSEEVKSKYRKMKEELQKKRKQAMDLLKDIVEGELDEDMTPEDLAP